MKKICILILLAALLLLTIPLAAAEDTSVLRGYSKGYQYVLMGNYPYDSDGLVWGNDPYGSGNTKDEPVLWRILSVEDNTVLLLTEYVIELQQVTFIHDEEAIKHYDFPRHEKYSQTDLCHWINEEMLPHLFDQDPLVYALMEEGENGRLFCLTSKQLLRSDYGFRETVKPTKVRITTPTPYARKRRIYRKDKPINYKAGGTPYWVGSMMEGKSKLHIVGYDGHISGGVYSRDNIGIRPAVRLNLDLIGIESGTGTQKDPFILKYTGEIPAETPEAAADTETMPETETEAEEPDPGQAEEPGQDPEDETIPVPIAIERPEGTALVSFLGDCSIGDAVSAAGKAGSYQTVVDREGYAWPFSLVQKYIGTDDMTVGNLEIVITTRTRHKNIVYPLRADPDHVNILTEGSIEVLNTANNHCYDFYRDGYVDTLQALDDAGIDRFGCVNYTRKNGFDDVLVKDVNGIRFGMIGFTYPTDADVKHAEQLIKKLREEDHCDYVIVSLHWGRETYTVPGQGNAKYAKKMLDAGADMIYGHHPHVLQPIAFHNNKPILFSTGNCTFGTLSNNMDQHAGIFQITFEKTENGAVPRRLEVIPCKYYKSGDYRIEEETDEAEREKTFKILSPGRNLANCVNPPDSFLKTGVILFNEAGELIADQ